ncbi:hypothetical protein TCT1_05200 [Xenorhabdus sp. TCT-1]|uniref:Uncharacterized protein n=1 Tax=Xenorhabdus taiwanensis TaxID=3085177 RepID=A0ABM8JSE2_9GAMM|nr:hypothetical protein TCT1_05200 [Xenorhabdus sp. TCT-1]
MIMFAKNIRSIKNTYNIPDPMFIEIKHNTRENNCIMFPIMIFLSILADLVIFLLTIAQGSHIINNIIYI